MSYVISISSDEEDFANGERPVKKIKLNWCEEQIQQANKEVTNSDVIVLDDEGEIAYKNSAKEKSEILPNGKSSVRMKNTTPNKNNINIPKVIKIDSSKVPISKEAEECTNSNNRKAVNYCESNNKSMVENGEPIEYKSKDLNETEDPQLENCNAGDKNIKDNNQDIKDPEPSTSKTTIIFDNPKMQEFINTCLDQIENPETISLFKSKIPMCKRVFNKIGKEYTNSEMFGKELEKKIALSKKSPYMAVQCFNDIYIHLKAQKKYLAAGMSKDEKDHSKIIKKLENTLNKLEKRIKKLKAEEVDFDQEEDSSYIQLARYQERAAKVYAKLCKYRKEDPYCDNIMHNRLDFSNSKLPEFNKAINRKYKNNLVFPTYFDVERCLKKCVDSNNIQISEAEFKAEARHCFEKLGNLIQYRRKMDLLYLHSDYVPSNQDPASEDTDLNTKLNSHKATATSKIQEICEKYSRLQETGENPNLSSDTDDSKLEGSGDEVQS